MKADAVVFTAPRVVRVRSVDCPDPSPGDVVVRVTQSWISNGTEGSYLRGERSDGDTPFAPGDPLPFPVVAGYQKIGVVEALGSEASDLEIGETVFATIGLVEGMHHGYAGHVSPSVCPRGEVFRLPAGADPLAFAPLVLAQVGYNGGMRPPVSPGDAAVVVGDGMVGHWTAQTLRARGAEVALVGRHAERLTLFPPAGGGTPTHRIDASQGHWTGEVRALFPDGVHVGVDTVGSLEVMGGLQACARRFGHLVSAGFYGPDDRLALQPPRYKELSIHLVSGWTRERLEATLKAVARGTLQTLPLLTHRFPVAQAAEAWDLIESKREHVLGVVLDWE
jgi:2-desacetyl-2-hydroxyethyl bacteriochlorophyllide A dehydrogenase